MRYVRSIVTVGSFAVIALLCTAQTQDASATTTIQTLQKDIERLRAEVNALRAEVQNLRQQLRDPSRAEPVDKSPDPAAYESPTLTQIDQKLDRVLAELAALKKDAGAARTEPRRPATELAGKPAPAFSLATLAGTPVSNADLARYPATVLNFVAPNCGYCAKQIPKVERIRDQYQAKGVRFVNVNEQMGEKPHTADEAHARYTSMGSNLELAMDPENKIGKLFKATAYPTMFVVRSDGVVAHVNIGAKDNIDEMLRQQLAVLLGEPAPTSAPGALDKD